jgi:Domain of unknown function (DUF5005)
VDMKTRTITLLSMLLISSCTRFQGRQKTADSELKAVQDTIFTEMFKRECCGFTGGDGTISILLPDGRIAWLFGDTFLGKVYPDRTRERTTPIFIRNSMVVQHGDSVVTLHQGTAEHPASFVIPPRDMTGGKKVSEDSVWFWPCDGFIENNKLKIFLSGMTQADTGMWGFRWLGIWLAVYSLPDIKEEKIISIPYGVENQVHYGNAILEEKDYTYVYGARESKPHAARFKTGDVESPWEFYTGTGWSSKAGTSRPMRGTNVSEQFSIFKITNKYVLITQTGFFLSPQIYSFISDSPYGPWKNKTLLYVTPLPEDNKNLFTYNAMAHPEFTDKGMLLISYNMNSNILADHFRDADIYRPRFIRVPLKLIYPTF